MIIADEADLTRAVQPEVERTPDPRLRRLLAAFGVTAALIGHYEADDQTNEVAPDADVKGRWYSLQHRFVVIGGKRSCRRRRLRGRWRGPGPSRLPCKGTESGTRPVVRSRVCGG
jgi:hypothetical protein